MKDIVIVGSGGFAKEVAFLIDEINRHSSVWNLLGFIDSEEVVGICKYNTYNNDEWLLKTENEISIVFGIGNPVLCKELQQKFSSNRNIKYPNLIHPNVIADWDRVKIGLGNIICASNTLTTDIEIGSFNILNLNCTIGHDTVIGDYNVINPMVNISGGVQIEDCILIGTNATLLQYKKVCSNSTIGAGALVTKNVMEPGIYVGSPAKKFR